TASVLAGTAGRPDKPALIDGVSGQALTYADLGRAVGSAPPPRGYRRRGGRPARRGGRRDSRRIRHAAARRLLQPGRDLAVRRLTGGRLQADQAARSNRGGFPNALRENSAPDHSGRCHRRLLTPGAGVTYALS